MNKTKILWTLIFVLVIGLSFLSFKNLTNYMEGVGPAPVVTVPEIPEGTACTMEAKICPDGTAVGRTGPKCEFAACPSPDATKATVTTYLDGNVTSLNVTINPREIISDSRCPLDVQCIWAGTVEVRTAISTQVAHGEHVLKLGEPRVFGDHTVTLTDVTPTPHPDEKIALSSYRFTFEIKKK